jgi:hypothetical protein
MSFEIGMDTIRLRPTKRCGHTEYCSHETLMERVSAEASRAAGRRVGFSEAWELDLLWSTNDGPYAWGKLGRVTDMGHAVFLRDGRDKRPAQPCPFRSVQEALAFDAVREYGLTDHDTLVAFYQDRWQRAQHRNPDQVFTAGYYRTIVSGAIEVFGWDMLLEAAAYRHEFERVLDSIFRLSLHHFKAWARTSAPVFICHDDMVWSAGPFMHPQFYRDVVFPRYRQLWQVLRDAGKKVLYCSDGTWTEFVDDIADAGADGFIFEPTTDFDYIVSRHGGKKVIVGSKVDCRTLTFGTKDQIKAEIDATLDVARDLPGFMFAVGNHIPSNVPLDNALFYHDYLTAKWNRT